VLASVNTTLRLIANRSRTYTIDEGWVLFLFKQCSQIRPLLSYYADNRLENAERRRIRRHLNKCKNCEKYLFHHRSRLATLATVGLDDLLRVRLQLELELTRVRRFGQKIASLMLLSICVSFLYFGSHLAARHFQSTQDPSDSPLGLASIAVISSTTPSSPNSPRPAPVLKTLSKNTGIALGVGKKMTIKPPAGASVSPKPRPKKRSPEPPIKEVIKVPNPIKPRPQKLNWRSHPKPRLYVVIKALKSIVRDHSGPPKEIAKQLARLGVSAGYRYGEMLFFPVLDKSEADQVKFASSRLPINVIEELSPPFPSRVAASCLGRRQPWPFLPGSLLSLPWGWRIVRDGPQDLTATQIISVISISDPDVLLLERLGSRYNRFRKVLHPCPIMAPKSVRQGLMLKQSNGHIRRLLWDAFLNGSDGVPRQSRDPFVPANSRKSQKLARSLKARRLAIETEIMELNRRLRHLFVLEKGLRGVAMSLGDRAYSVDLFASPKDTLRAMPILVQGMALEAFEASLYTPIAGNSRALLKRRTETLGIHQLLIGLTRNLKGNPNDGYLYQHKDKALQSVMQLKLDRKKQFKHGIILKIP
jgi:hypothetical protein